MTEENKDIEKEETPEIEQVEKKVKSPRPGPIEMIVANIALFAVIFILLSFLLGTSIMHYPSSCYSSQTSESIAHSLLQSLQSAAAIYTKQQQEPKVFSDFVIAEGPDLGQHTLSLANINAIPKFIETKTMKLTFERDCTAIYHLNGSDVTASFNFENQENPFKEQQKQQIIFFIVITVITTIIFIFLKSPIGDFNVKISIFITIIIIWVFLMANYFTIRKPAIYLYPEKPTEVNITLDKSIDITLDVPKYVANKGWHVMAYPNSKIVDLQPQHTNCNDLDPKIFGLEYAKEACLNNDYPYIYWEGIPAKKCLPSQDKGWLVKTANIKGFLNRKLEYVGFNKAEKDEFLRYWAHKIKEAKQETVFISFMQTAEIEEYFPMTVTPKPDSINRFYIIVDLNINNHKKPQPQELKKFNREGFTLVDWGGAMIGLSHIRYLR